jgi:long-chain acyl-CoA synthetase
VAGECPALERIVIFDMKGLRDLADPRCESFSQFCARGIDHDQSNPGAWEGAIAALTGEQPASLLGASALSHREIFNCATAPSGARAGDERLAFLPMSDPAERLHGCYKALFTGVVSNYAESPDTVLENLQEVQPTVLCATPDTWQRLHARIELAVADATPLQRSAYRLAIRASPAWLADQLVLRNVRRDIGLDRLRLATVASPPVSPEVARWYRALGIELRPVDNRAGGGADC